MGAGIKGVTVYEAAVQCSCRQTLILLSKALSTLATTVAEFGDSRRIQRGEFGDNTATNCRFRFQRL